MAEKATVRKGGSGAERAALVAVTAAQVAVRMNSVMFPIDGVQLLRALSKEGFIPPEVPEGARVAGAEARKGETRIRFDAEKMVLAAIASNPKDAVGQLEWLEKLAKTEFRVDTESIAHYYELVVTMVVKARRSPMEVWAAMAPDIPALTRLSDVFGRQLAPFGLRLFEPGHEPNSTEWFEVKVEPQLPNSTSQHFFQIILRNPRRQIVLDYGRRLEETVSRLFAALEEG